jgi:cytochrome c553
MVGHAFREGSAAVMARPRTVMLSAFPGRRGAPLAELLEEEVVLRSPAVTSLAALALPALAQAPDPNLARNLAAACANCHGTQGRSVGGLPSLAGQGKADLVRKMQDYRNGRQAGTVMPQLAKGYTDGQIDLIAGWFAAQKP